MADQAKFIPFGGSPTWFGPTWKVEVTAAEAKAVGLEWDNPHKHANKWGDLMRPILVAKGVPEHCLGSGATFLQDRDEQRKVVIYRFPDPSKQAQENSDNG